APTGGSMVLAGVLLKMGTYGFFRIAVPTLPEAAAQFAFPMALLGVIAIVYGALAAMAQPDLKKMVAYSSISHMGYVVLGIAAGVAGGSTMAMNGALFVMVSHGIISPLMFFLAGTMVYERTHTRMIPEMGGLWSQVPVVGTVLAFAAFANLGLPGLSGFAGEFFTFVGSFPVYTTLVIVGALGLILTAGYHLWMMQRVLLGELKGSPGGMVDITWRDAGHHLTVVDGQRASNVSHPSPCDLPAHTPGSGQPIGGGADQPGAARAGRLLSHGRHGYELHPALA